MSALDFAARAGAQEARDMAEAVVGTADAARGTAAKAESAAQAALTAADATGKALDASRQEMEAAREAADVAGRTAQAADRVAQAANGVAQQAERLARDAAAGAPRLFTSMSAASLPTGATVIGSSGFAAVGMGAATYVSDANATADLARSHPLACFKGEGGRYFRLMPDAQGAITPEQFGCPIPAVGSNAQPYLQATLDYAAAVPDVRQISFTQNYDLWNPIRISGTPTTAQQADYLYLRSTVKIVGTASDRVVLRFLNSQGGRNDIVTQRVVLPGIAGYEGGHDENNYPWMGSGLVPDRTKGLLDFIYLENIEMDGTYTYDEEKFYDANGQRTLHSTNLMHKAFSSDSSCRRVFMRNVYMHDWGGEIYYLGGSEVREEYLENCEFRGSPQCAINPGTPARSTYVNVVCADALQNEIVGGMGKTFVGGRWENLRGAGVFGGAQGDGRTHAGYSFGYPWRAPDTIPWCVFQDLRIERCKGFTLGSYSKGRIHVVDTPIILGGDFGKLEEIDLDIQATCDGQADAILYMGGPATLTEQVPNCDPGIYKQLPRNIDIRINAMRTRQAQESPAFGGGDNRAAWRTAVVYYGGMVEGNSVKITIDGTANDAFQTVNGLSGEAPQIVVLPTFKRSNPGIDPVGISILSTTGEQSVNVLPGDNPIALDGDDGLRLIRMRNTQGQRSWNWADGTQVSFTIRGAPGNSGYGDGRVVALFHPEAASEYVVPEARLLGQAGDRITFRRDNRANRWVEVSCETGTKVRFSGSGNISAREVAAGATVTIDFPVAGVRASDKRRDVVEWVEPTTGFVSSGSVISNDLVRVSVTNTGATAAALPGGVRRVRVLNGYAL
ncbi:hypothetical protein PK98_00745 [Croceibacterium mercuriale]|uniref:Uncharacterized protein n=1 Tax=Croceibacterium mercuriale TaxID=1572751 RepID=A0A0B2BUP9_9SPHN|nr:hypothetical protein [Croceibacterium mercuriale]KHL25303.1 hypothetical protein PK98_00745 [Croceibacterium mercuriale]